MTALATLFGRFVEALTIMYRVLRLRCVLCGERPQMIESAFCRECWRPHEKG